jgi:putative intracellular protease/amidase
MPTTRKPKEVKTTAPAVPARLSDEDFSAAMDKAFEGLDKVSCQEALRVVGARAMEALEARGAHPTDDEESFKDFAVVAAPTIAAVVREKHPLAEAAFAPAEALALEGDLSGALEAATKADRIMGEALKAIVPQVVEAYLAVHPEVLPAK